MFPDFTDTMYYQQQTFLILYLFDLRGYNKSFLFWKALFKTLCGINPAVNTAKGLHTEGLRSDKGAQ